MGLRISDSVRDKLLARHGVGEQDILECFANRCGKPLTDTREEHQTEPPTVWFVSQTDRGRVLKVVYVQARDGTIHIKTAYDANAEEKRIYEKYGKGS